MCATEIGKLTYCCVHLPCPPAPTAGHGQGLVLEQAPWEQVRSKSWKGPAGSLYSVSLSQGDWRGGVC